MTAGTAIPTTRAPAVSLVTTKITVATAVMAPPSPFGATRASQRLGRSWSQ